MPSALSPEELTIRDENRLEHVISKWQTTIVNEALKVVCEDQDLDRVTWVRGWTDTTEDGKMTPDWAVVVTPSQSDDQFDNASILPGESKVTHISFRQDLLHSTTVRDSDDPPDEVEDTPEIPAMKLYIAQACYYGRFHNSRYSYIITNRELVVIRAGPGCERTPRKPHTRRSGPQSPPLAFGLDTEMSSPPLPPLAREIKLTRP
jgi:hypothetical protein